MKHILPILALILFVFSCTKYESGYTVNCDFGSIYGEDKIIVVTDAYGQIIKTLDVPNGVNTLSEQFYAEGKDLPEQYDLHLVYQTNTFSFNGNIRGTDILSHLDVENGALVHFSKYPGFTNFIMPAFIEIRDLESFDSLDIADTYAINGAVSYLPAEKKIQYTPYIPNNQGLVIRLLANGESQFRHLYLPDSLVSDTISVAWQDFQPENNLKNIELPAGNSVYGLLEVSAVSPDFMHYVTLARRFGLSSLPQFNHPSGLQEPVAYSIRLELDGASYEKIFQPGEPLRFEVSDMAIDDFSADATKLSIRTKGQIDLLRAEFFAYESGTWTGFGDELYWKIEGKPASFENHILPVLSGHLPDWYDVSQAFKSGLITAEQYDNHDYPQIREGFPYRLNEPFAIARSGYRAVRKYY